VPLWLDGLAASQIAELLDCTRPGCAAGGAPLCLLMPPQALLV
jgi:hypothetical protein